MEVRLLLVLIALFMLSNQIRAQEPNLTEKETLPVQLYGVKSFNSATDVDTVVIPTQLPGDFTLEVKARINSAEGRGLDIEARKGDLNGFRTSADTETFNWRAPLSVSDMLYFSSTKEQTFRFAVEGNKVHIYQNGFYIVSKPATSIYDIVDGVENPLVSTYGENIVSDIFGYGEIVTPNEIDWGNNGAGTVPWKTTNSGSGVRIMDPLNGTSYNGETYTYPLILLRWESGVTNGSSYYYPVELEANTAYNFSYLQGYWDNGSPNSLKVGVSKEITGNNLISETSFEGSYNEKQQLFDGSLSFTTSEAGTYYLMFQNDGNGIWIVADPEVKKLDAVSRIIIGKNYKDGAVDIDLSSVTLDEDGAFAPLPNMEVETISKSISDETFSATKLINSHISVSGESELHLSGRDPLVNSSIDLQSNDSWLYFSEFRPSQFLSDLSGQVTVNGRVFDETIDRVEIYGSGCVIIPNGMKIANESALIVYSEPNFGGDSKAIEIETYYNNLEEWNNSIKSFKLKKGFAATFANNPDGTGHSRMFIASDEDLEISTMPEGFVASETTGESFISFVRVFRWRWTSKKGTAGNIGPINADVVYDWSAGGQSTLDTEYIPMRHNAGWDSYGLINNRQNTSHVLGFNEPERPDQANMPVTEAIRQWPNLFESGLRIGSPAPADMPRAWLTEFMHICDSTNLRVDFIATHAYQDQSTGWWDWFIYMASFGGMAAGETPRRPIWITEWNNGANWTNGADASKWPDDNGVRVDVNGYPILDKNGNEVNVALPLTAANAERQKNKLLEVLNHFETVDIFEHQFLYQWVNDARQLEINGELTPAGEAFNAFKSEVGFKKKNEYKHIWKIAPPFCRSWESEDYHNVTLSWYDHNSETGKNYIIERKLDSESSYSPIDTLFAAKDYKYGSTTVEYTDSLGHNSANYRVKATSYKDTESVYSRTVKILRNDPPQAPGNLFIEVNENEASLNWEEAAFATSYKIKKSSSRGGPFETIAEGITTTDFKDNFDGNITYYLVVAVNEFGESPHSNRVSTKQSDKYIYLRFDEGEGEIAEDSWSGLDGKLVGGAFWSEGKAGKSAFLSGNNNSHVALVDGVMESIKEYTISVWVKLEENPTWNRIFDFGSGTGTYMFLTPKSGNNTVRYAIKKGGNEQRINGLSPLSLNEWHHLALTQKDTIGILYIDGKEVGRNENMDLNPTDLGTTTQNWIGKSQWPDPLMKGNVDEFRIYNYALNSGEIGDLFVEEITPAPFQYVISFESEYGQMPQEMRFTSVDEIPDLPEMEDTDTHLFQGWKKADGELVTELSAIIPADADGSITLFAIWEEIPVEVYAITYHNVDFEGVVNPNPTEQEVGTVLELQSAIASSYRFMGWYLNADFTSEISSIEGNNSSDMEIYGRWKLKGEFIAYPTLTEGTVSFRSSEANDMIILSNSIGVIVKRLQTSSVQERFDFSNLPTGLYVARSLKTGLTTRIIKK
ncbi:glycosyl hydrolase [Echinicola jeungdonensis]|uniref:LamG-like jellyroll fold domain-containing protein n=1 Tax=Echinicola jeungdonensis TaxID=709343 RepID=A0ABV5J1G3_9BACT|nr:LamG-like jellyroll fold domain-containing protein [Echinicola jeungdonensis]MDN3668497.1 glycosyl hydrolase [Echinicola jeungdonensis]